MAANILQSRFETAVVEQDRLHELGCKGLFLIIVMMSCYLIYTVFIWEII